MAIKVTSFEPVSRKDDWIDGGRILAIVDIVDEDSGLMLLDLFLTYDGEKPRLRAAKRKGKAAQVYMTEGKPFHDRAAQAAKAHYDGFTLEELRVVKDTWELKSKAEPKGELIAEVWPHRKAA
ncbi:hypothetical protein FY137_06045 [Agrobacterium tumefaciens]|nr:hypothetical protein FY137_06045 [Agrobacterium tumefaciens]